MNSSIPLMSAATFSGTEEETAAALEISPAVEGTITFEDDNHTMRFTPATRFEPGVEYTVTLGTGACHPDATYENHLKEPFSFKFRTQNRGSVRISQTYPMTNSDNIPLNPSFIALFDAKIVNRTAQNNVAVIDAKGNALQINSRSFKFNQGAGGGGHVAFELTQELEPNTAYTFQIYPELADVDGIMLNDTISIPFHTGDAVEPSIPMVNDLDDLFFVGDKDNSVGVVSVSTLRYTAKKMEGQASNKLAYTYGEANGEAHYAATDLTAYKGNSKSTFGLYVFADYSFNTLYAKWAVEGDIQYTKICDLDYAGWLYQEADMSSLPAGVDYQFMGLKLVRGTSSLSEKGEVSVDALRVKFEPTSTDIENVETVTPAQNKVIENGYLNILLNGVKYNVQGATIK